MKLAASASLIALLPTVALCGDKKKTKAAAVPLQNILEKIDYSKIVWPNPPAITRVKFLDQFVGEKLDPQAAAARKRKSSWMDRLAGVSEEEKNGKPRFVLGQPFGVGVDSKGKVYVADQKVGAIFIFDTKTKDVEFIKHGVQAKFDLITGLAIDDADKLFVADANLHHVLVFNPQRALEATISDSLDQPVGLAVDNENRFVYVADSARDQVLVYDADSYKLLRKIGTTGKNHALTEPGEFSRPVGVAVDGDGNLYVSDTFNNRIEIFDADGAFISTFGKPGDGPGTLGRPKGLAIDCDGHIWVADTVQNRVQVFNREGKLLIWFGGTGLLPGQLSVPVGIAIDKENRVFTTEQLPGRLQMFRYFTQAEAVAENERREKDQLAKRGPGQGTKPAASSAKTPEESKPKSPGQ